MKHRDARKQLASFLDFASYSNVLPLTEQSVTVSAEVYASLRARGKPVDDIDLLIAGIAIANDLVFVTHNLGHFNRIEELEVRDWNEEV